jgi:hypothetical protein
MFYWKKDEVPAVRGSVDRKTTIITRFVKLLCELKSMNADADICVIWDDDSVRRKYEAVTQGVSAVARHAAYHSGEGEDVLTQTAYMKAQILPCLGISQFTSSGHEAYDVIYSFIAGQDNASVGKIIIVSTDRIYYQFLTDDITVFNPSSGKMVDKVSFTSEKGFSPVLWKDYWTLTGGGKKDAFSIAGCGDKTATELIREYGNLLEIIKGISQKEKRTKIEQDILDNCPVLRVGLDRIKPDMCGVVSLFQNHSRKEEDIKGLMIKWGLVSLIRYAKYFI